MKRHLFAFLAGGLFGTGLYLSGMTNTQKVIGWLDFFGDWDPTLAFVLTGAIIPMAVAWSMTKARPVSLLGTPLPSKPATRIDPNLAVGSVLFGAGWGLAGLCPGPAMASVTWGGTGGALFLLSMIVGIVIAPPIRKALAARAPQ